MSDWGTGELPGGWAWATLGEVADVRLGKMLDAKRQTGEHAMPYLRNINVQWHRTDLGDLLQMDVAPEERDRYTVRAGDLLVCEGGEPGRCSIVPETAGGLAYQKALHRVRPADGVLPAYLAYLLELMAQTGRLSPYFTGSTIKHLPREKAVALPVPVAPLEEQRRIVTALEEHLPQLDTTLRDADALHQHLERLEEAVIHSAVLGRLVPGTAEAVPAETHLAAALDATPEPDTPHLPGLPAGWTWTTLGALCDVTGGVTKDAKKQSDPSYVEVPYLRVANVQKGRLDLSEVARIRVPVAKAEALRLLPGDVLFNEGGDRDKLGRGWVWDGQVADCIHQNHVFRGRIRGGVLDPRLLSWHGNTFGRRWFEAAGKQTTNLASLSMTNLKRLPVPVPPLADQPIIVAEVQRRLSIIRAARGDLTTVRRKVQLLRRSLLHAAFTGQLVGRDSTDETAELLLKRIAGERALAAPTARRRRALTVAEVPTTDKILLVEEPT